MEMQMQSNISPHLLDRMQKQKKEHSVSNAPVIGNNILDLVVTAA